MQGTAPSRQLHPAYVAFHAAPLRPPCCSQRPAALQRAPSCPHSPSPASVVPAVLAAGAQLRFRDLVGGKNVKADRRRQRLQAAGRLALDTALFTLLWWAWTQLQPAAQ